MDRLYYLTVPTPAGTPASSPISTNWPLEDNELAYVDVRVPPGPSGLLYFRILYAQQQIVPWGNNSYFNPDDEIIHWQSDAAMTVTGLVIQTYNLGSYQHTIYLRALIKTMTVQEEITASEYSGSLALPTAPVSSDQSSGTLFMAPIQTLTSELPTEISPTEQGIGAVSVAPVENFAPVIPLARDQIGKTRPIVRHAPLKKVPR